jgi:hypothetical protein
MTAVSCTPSCEAGFRICRSFSSGRFQSVSILSRIAKEGFFETGLVEMVIPPSVEFVPWRVLITEDHRCLSRSRKWWTEGTTTWTNHWEIELFMNSLLRTIVLISHSPDSTRYWFLITKCQCDHLWGRLWVFLSQSCDVSHSSRYYQTRVHSCLLFSLPQFEWISLWLSSEVRFNFPTFW